MNPSYYNNTVPVGGNMPPKYITPTPPVMERSSIVASVAGEAGVDAYLLAPLYTAYLIDNQERFICIKSTDEYGRYLPMKRFERVDDGTRPVQEEPVGEEVTNYATTDQLEGYAKQSDYEALFDIVSDLQKEISSLRAADETPTRGRKAGKTQDDK